MNHLVWDISRPQATYESLGMGRFTASRNTSRPQGMDHCLTKHMNHWVWDMSRPQGMNRCLKKPMARLLCDTHCRKKQRDRLVRGISRPQATYESLGMGHFIASRDNSRPKGMGRCLTYISRPQGMGRGLKKLMLP
jgi:hypothetical protein